MIDGRITQLSHARKEKYYLVRNARMIVKFYNEGKTISEIAQFFEVSQATVREILHRYRDLGLRGLYDRRPISHKGRFKPSA